MSYSPGTGGRVLIDSPTDLSVSVTIAPASGASAIIYSDVARTASVSMPATITGKTTFYTAKDDTYTVSCMVGSTECGPGGTYELRNDTQATVGVNAELSQNVAASAGGGGSVPLSYLAVAATSTPTNGTDATLGTALVEGSDFEVDSGNAHRINVLNDCDRVQILIDFGCTLSATADGRIGIGLAGSWNSTNAPLLDFGDNSENVAVRPTAGSGSKLAFERVVSLPVQPLKAGVTLGINVNADLAAGSVSGAFAMIYVTKLA